MGTNFPYTLLSLDDIRKKIRLISDFPKNGVIYRDLYSIYLDKHAFDSLVRHLAEMIKQEIGNFDCVAAVEAQGFIVGGALAKYFNKGFLAIRKQHKLPGETNALICPMEYASVTLEIQKGVLGSKKKILIFDDTLATGQTALAMERLISQEQALIVGFAFLMETVHFGARKLFGDKKIISLLQFD